MSRVQRRQALAPTNCWIVLTSSNHGLRPNRFVSSSANRTDTVASGSGDAKRLWGWVEQLGRIGGDGHGGVSRYGWTYELRRAVDWLANRCADLDLTTTIDAAGNLIAVWGSVSEPRVTVGSHLDTVPDGGRFDGALGVLCGLEAIAILREQGHRPRRPVALIAWMDEEGTRFGTPLFGSKAFVGHDLSGLADRIDADGVSLAAAMASWDRSFSALPDARALDVTEAYLEVHVEQGPVLDRAGIDVGLVTAITGVMGLEVAFIGQANHAGTTPMDQRSDALVAAARAIVAIKRWASEHPDGARATVGIVDAVPGGYNVIPGEAQCIVDVRATTDVGLADSERAIRELVSEAAAAEGTEGRVTVRNVLAPTPMDAGLRELLGAAADADGASSMQLPSGAGHDAMHLAPHVPTAMLLVPSRGGISHNPAEHTDPDACHTGARVLARALAELTRRPAA